VGIEYAAAHLFRLNKVQVSFKFDFGDR